MSLEDKLYDKIQFYVYANESGYVDGIQDASNQCVQICDEFAVGFSDWKDKKYWYSRDKKCYVKYGMPNSSYTTTELLEIYKQGL